MEKRNIKITFDKAREWYNSGSADLKEIALQAYSEDELTIPEWCNIKTFEDACKALNYDEHFVQSNLRAITGCINANHIIAIYKLDIIRRALNKGWNPKITEGTVYYPYIKFYPAGDKAEENARINNWEVKEIFEADGEKYTLIGAVYLTYFNSRYGDVQLDLGLLGCKSKEIAQHMSRYFAKEIFEACYTYFTDAYKWV